MSTATVLAFGKKRVERTAAMERYEHVYRVAENTIDFGETVRLAGIFLGGVLIIAGIIAFQVNRTEQLGFPGASLALGACAITVVLVAHVLDRYFRAQGHLLEMATDAAIPVCSSAAYRFHTRAATQWTRHRFAWCLPYFLTCFSTYARTHQRKDQHAEH
jgi:hypothetical protein